MTSPVSQGYADWSRREPISDLVLIQDLAHNTNVTVSYGLFYVAQFRSIWIRFSSTGARGRVTVSSLDITTLVTIDNHFIDVGDGQVIKLTLRPSTAFMNISVSPQAASTITFDLSVTATSDAYGLIARADQTVLINKAGATVNAATTNTDVAVASHVGLVYYQAFCAAAAWTSDLQSIDLAGTVRTLARTDNTRGGKELLCFSPGGDLRIVTHNVDAAAKSYDAILTAYPDVGR